MVLKVLAFGMARDIMGKPLVELNVGGKSVTSAQLKTALLERYPELKSLGSFFIAVNSEYSYDDVRLKTTDEIAIIPPTSGG